ncbi:MAG TPA: Rap1a/Tai family immunity protein [Rhizomicrobium sp.]|nr:Rap1a/Tai family immunity protein [Rhizomicrobium sp.]
MKFAPACCLIVASFALAAPASAYTGMEFSQQCGNGPPRALLDSPFCHGFLLGFYDALAASGQMCPRKRPTDRQIATTVQNWLRFRAGHPGNPTGYMIRNALVHAWGCR